MKRTIVVLSHNRPIQDRTRMCLQQLTAAGAAFLSQSGCADVSLARCDALSGACNALRQLNEGRREAVARDTILMVDDDMVFDLDQAQALIDHSRETGVPTSAIYATTLATIAATRLAGTDRWLTGLGLLAIPASALLELEQDSQPFALLNDKKCRAFTWSGPKNGSWYSEDYTLCERLGGVHLLPIGVGHLKTYAIYPDTETIAAIRDGRKIVGVAGPEQLEHLTQSQLTKGSK